MKYRVYIVEDDKKIADIIAVNLKKWNYDSLIAKDFTDIEKEFIEYKPHMILLDIVLPYYDGFCWCEKIRRSSKAPIIFISSKNANMDIIMAVNMGGDDFIVKPFSINVLVAKVNALFRRAYSYTNSEPDILEHNDMILNMAADCLIYKDSSVELSSNEKKILSILFRNNGKIVPREDIQRSLWDSEDFIDDNTLTVNINRIRKKLESLGLSEIIKTKKGSGYTIE